MNIKKNNQQSVYDGLPHSYQRGDILLSVQNAAVIYNLSRSFIRKQKFEALSDISFDVRAGESIGIIGPNGAGKSTLLMLLAGVIKPDRGKVINYGVEVSLLALQAGFVKDLSGYDNVILSGLALGFSKAVIFEKMDEIIEFSGIRAHIEFPVRTYSTGMVARLGFSIAHMLHSDILLIDETLGVGDKDFQKKSSKAMKEKIQSDQTVILVSHNIVSIRELCNRVVWIENGIVISEGPVDKVMDEYEKEK